MEREDQTRTTAVRDQLGSSTALDVARVKKPTSLLAAVIRKINEIEGFMKFEANLGVVEELFRELEQKVSTLKIAVEEEELRSGTLDSDRIALSNWWEEKSAKIERSKENIQGWIRRTQDSWVKPSDSVSVASSGRSRTSGVSNASSAARVELARKKAEAVAEKHLQTQLRKLRADKRKAQYEREDRERRAQRAADEEEEGFRLIEEEIRSSAQLEKNSKFSEELDVIEGVKNTSKVYKERLEIVSKSGGGKGRINGLTVIGKPPAPPPRRMLKKKRNRLYEEVLSDMKKLETRLKKHTNESGPEGLDTTEPKSRPHLEIYVDSDRAAGVSMFSRDIKRQFREVSEIKHVELTQQSSEHLWKVYRSSGSAFVKRQEFAKAIECFDRAIDLDVSFEGIYLDRCHCHLALGHLEEALVDAKTALSFEADYVNAMLLKARCHFRLGEYEFAGVWYHRFLRARPMSTLTKQARFGLSGSEMAIKKIVNDNLSAIELTNQEQAFKHFQNLLPEEQPLKLKNMS
ncbi:hypothetical protein TCAL_16585 [Tigriopus californicus]|uniref:Outer dynein arm-docking complex subunit 4 n=1 Tax=Tigriopus californicus TaxID=6832 RepID=A0A553NE18_TIGCA|nr:hypothetical protein TCAL_16585 [Tigriopus californicus]